MTDNRTFDHRIAMAVIDQPMLQIAAGDGQVFTVEEVECNLFQAVFPAAMSTQSQLFATRIGAWQYIIETIGEMQ